MDGAPYTPPDPQARAGASSLLPSGSGLRYDIVPSNMLAGARQPLARQPAAQTFNFPQAYAPTPSFSNATYPYPGPSALVPPGAFYGQPIPYPVAGPQHFQPQNHFYTPAFPLPALAYTPVQTNPLPTPGWPAIYPSYYPPPDFSFPTLASLGHGNALDVPSQYSNLPLSAADLEVFADIYAADKLLDETYIPAETSAAAQNSFTPALPQSLPFELPPEIYNAAYNISNTASTSTVPAASSSRQVEPQGVQASFTWDQTPERVASRESEGRVVEPEPAEERILPTPGPSTAVAPAPNVPQAAPKGKGKAKAANKGKSRPRAPPREGESKFRYCPAPPRGRAQPPPLFPFMQPAVAVQAAPPLAPDRASSPGFEEVKAPPPGVVYKARAVPAPTPTPTVAPAVVPAVVPAAPFVAPPAPAAAPAPPPAAAATARKRTFAEASSEGPGVQPEDPAVWSVAYPFSAHERWMPPGANPSSYPPPKRLHALPAVAGAASQDKAKEDTGASNVAKPAVVAKKPRAKKPKTTEAASTKPAGKGKGKGKGKASAEPIDTTKSAGASSSSTSASNAVAGPSKPATAAPVRPPVPAFEMPTIATDDCNAFALALPTTSASKVAQPSGPPAPAPSAVPPPPVPAAAAASSSSGIATTESMAPATSGPKVVEHAPASPKPVSPMKAKVPVSRPGTKKSVSPKKVASASYNVKPTGSKRVSVDGPSGLTASEKAKAARAAQATETANAVEAQATATAAIEATTKQEDEDEEDSDLALELNLGLAGLPPANEEGEGFDQHSENETPANDDNDDDDGDDLFGSGGLFSDASYQEAIMPSVAQPKEDVRNAANPSRAAEGLGAFESVRHHFRPEASKTLSKTDLFAEELAAPKSTETAKQAASGEEDGDWDLALELKEGLAELPSADKEGKEPEWPLWAGPSEMPADGDSDDLFGNGGLFSDD